MNTNLTKFVFRMSERQPFRKYSFLYACVITMVYMVRNIVPCVILLI